MKNFDDYTFEKIKRQINVFTLIFSMLMLFDIILGVQVYEEEIEKKVFYEQGTGSLQSYSKRAVIGIITNKNEYPLKNTSLYNASKKGDKILIYKSRILGEVTKINYNNVEYLDAAYSIYAFNYLFPIICIVSSFCAFLLDKLKRPYFDFFLVLSTLLTVFLSFSMFTSKII